MPQSSLNGWLNKPGSNGTSQQSIPPPPVTLPAPKRPPPPPKSVSAPPRVPSATTPVPSAMENWNDIPDDFLQAPSRPRSKKSPRSSRAPTPAVSRVVTPVPPPAHQPAIPQLFALRPLPPNVELAPLNEQLLPAFQRLVALTLPIPYPDSFFKETMTEPQLGITLVALWHSRNEDSGSSLKTQEEPRLVGAIRCRLLPSSQLYISTIGILAPYRTHGIAMHLLQAVVRKAVDLHSVRCITAHVWEANDEGLEWYKKRNFEIVGKEESYYRKLRPQGAFLARKWIGVGDLLGNGTADDKSGPA
ncbi:hypothetical protein ACN47E_007830 [Coniothyrium glycines]